MEQQVFVHDNLTGKSYLRDMTDEEIAQAEIDLRIPKQWTEEAPETLT